MVNTPQNRDISGEDILWSCYNQFLPALKVKLAPGSKVYPEVNTYADLPIAGAGNNGYVYLVLQNTFTLLVFNTKPAGLYRSDGVTWEYLGPVPSILADNQFKLYDSDNTTAQMAFDCSNISPMTTRVLKMSNWDQDLENPLFNSIDFDTTPIVTMQEGRMAWDSNNGTVMIGMPGGNVNLQLGQEQHIRAKATENISDGQAVRISGASGQRAEMSLVNNTEDLSVDTIAIATENIISGQSGYFTTFGLVNDINTSALTQGGPVYLGATDGSLTATIPTAPNICIYIGTCIYKHATEGKIFVNINSKEWSRNFQEAQDTTGIPAAERAKFTIDYNHATQVLTLTKISDWYYYYKGTRVTVTGNITATAHTNAYGMYFYYFTGTTPTLTPTTDPWTISTDNVLITEVLYNPAATSTIKGFAVEERHGLRDTGWHYNQHFSEGAKYISGGAVADFVLDTDTVAATTWSVAATTIADEDLVTTTSAQTDGSGYTLLFRNASNQWDWITGSATPYFISNNNITYNPVGSGLTEVTTTNRWFNIYAVAVPAVSSTFQNICMIGKQLYTSLELAKGEDFNSEFPRTGFLPEFAPLAQFNFYYNAGQSTTTGKSEIDDYRYLRGQITIAGSAPINVHNNLSGLQGGAANAYYHSNQAINTTDSPTFAGETLSGLTANTILSADANKAITSLATATYPSLTELSYVKGVTSSIQTQINANARLSGEIVMYGGISAPTGWLFCNGATVSRSTYANLFSAITDSKGTFTVTIASPAVVTLSSHGFATGDNVYLTTTGALPTGLSANTNYFVIAINATTFNLATSYANAIAGTKINTSGTQSGTHTLVYSPYGISGATNFILPDMRGVSPAGAGTSTGYTTNETIALGTKYNDRSQGHWHNIYVGSGTSYTQNSYSSATGSVGNGNQILATTTTGSEAREFRGTVMLDDGTNGTPRIGTTTKGKSLGVNFIIKT